MPHFQSGELSNFARLEPHGAITGFQPSCGGHSWYAVWTRSRHEKAAAAVLAAHGIECYLPLTTELRQWSDRKQLVEVPLFAGYLFVRIDLQSASRLSISKVPGVVRFVTDQSGPARIPDQQIEDIRSVLAAKVGCSVELQLEEGQRVRIVRGVLAGLEGTLTQRNSTSRLLISIRMIRQSLAVNVKREDVEPVEPGLTMPSNLRVTSMLPV